MAANLTWSWAMGHGLPKVSPSLPKGNLVASVPLGLTSRFRDLYYQCNCASQQGLLSTNLQLRSKHILLLIICCNARPESISL